MIGAFAKSSFAIAQVVPKTIEFQMSPLFGESNFAPGDSVSRWVKVTNSTSDNHRTIVRALNINNESKFGDAVILQIKKGDIILYENTFSDFFNKSEIILPQVEPGETDIINFIAIFKSESGNNYQDKNMNFSLQVGLEDVESSTDVTTVIGGGGGITMGQKRLVITNESSVFTQGENNSINIKWNTNLPATSQVIYGLTSGGPYNLDLSAVNFGYPFSTSESDLGLDKKTNHSVNINNLTDGLYGYRVVSRASPATVGYEHYFMVSNNNINLIDINTKNKNLNANQLASNLNIDKSLIESLDMNTLDEKMGNILGASAGSIMGIPNSWFWFSLILLVLLFIFIIIYRRRKNKKVK